VVAAPIRAARALPIRSAGARTDATRQRARLRRVRAAQYVHHIPLPGAGRPSAASPDWFPAPRWRDVIVRAARLY